MKPGLYEVIKNREISEALEKTDELEAVDTPLHEADSADHLAQYLYHLMIYVLHQIRSDHDQNIIDRQITLCNRIIDTAESLGTDLSAFRIDTKGDRLLAVLTAAEYMVSRHPVRPDTPISLGSLLTGARKDPSLVSQLQKEISSADRVDILCSFIKWSGIRILREALTARTSQGKELRVITTSYMGATELKAIEMLSDLPNTTIKISYDTHRTRLHAKAYLFYRATGFSTAYIGSSNISYAALTDGLEWNTKISQYEQPYQWDKITATFETYWHDREFVPYDHEEREYLQQALQTERTGRSSDTIGYLQFVDIRPYGFQQEILDTISAERLIHHRVRHLVVAATGTGKTMIAAFDFRTWSMNFAKTASNHTYPRFLFIAHRKEILEQSLRTFRMVLRDQNFGAVMDGGNTPSSIDQLFLSVQSFRTKTFSRRLPRTYYDYIIIDEFHHAAAASYKDLLDYFTPASLLGLTATPERNDGIDLFHYFDDHITAEIRLPDAIDRKLLCPFQYFGVTDTIDLSHLTWSKGSYLTSELDHILTGNHVRAQQILDRLQDYVLDIRKMRALGFCVTQSHAQFMSQWCNDHGVSSACLTSRSSRKDRSNVQQKLRDRTVNLIFVVDLYNEGIDIPEVDTILFLRPTESLTVFLQQLGRGLRLYKEKDYLTVLDFVGQAHKKFRFDLRYRALIEQGTYRFKDEMEAGFPHLPAGCSIQFERVAKEYIFENIRQTLSVRRNYLVPQIASFRQDTGKAVTLERFISYYALTLDDIYRNSTWSSLCAEAEVIPPYTAHDEKQRRTGMRRIKHVDDIDYIDTLLQLLTKTATVDTETKRRYAMMGLFSLWGCKTQIQNITEGIKRLHQQEVLCKELIDLLELRRDQITNTFKPIAMDFILPLHLHSRYTRDEILTALGKWDFSKRVPVQGGVLYLKHINTDIFFITLDKQEKHYSPTTMYQDYAIDERLFHWQSQSTTSVSSPTGQRYIHQRERKSTVLLFVREQKSINSLSEPYYFLGPADYVNHTSSRPINIIWRLRRPMPAHLRAKTARMVLP